MNALVQSQVTAIDIQFAEETLDLQKRQHKWAACRHVYAPVFERFELLGAEPRFQWGSLTISLTGDKEKLAAAVRILRTSGFNTSAERPKVGSSSWAAIFRNPDAVLEFAFHFTSSVCRQVQVGTKTVEQPVFETRCGDLGDVTVAPLAVGPIVDDGMPF